MVRRFFANYSYDAGDRLVQAVDSVTGTITRSYDGLDRLTSEVSPRGSVSYSYDAAGRRTSMTVSGQAAVTYQHDNANRLTQITQGSATVAIAPDSDGRRQSVMLPNGVNMTYGYDAASQLTGINYKLGGNTLGNLTYAYDLAGRRINVGGTFARTGLPNALTSASYNANNQLTQFGGTSLAYDANGNLTSDGTNTYTWNARNQLVSISGGVAASFQYDAFGRRVSKTIGGTTQYVYDGANPVQEISGTTASANLLTGGVDEYFQRTDSAGARHYLTDALGSTLALADAAGAIQTSYTFEPFGNTTVSGASTTNSFAFTGRELDAPNLYFYRARYYSPIFGRFVSEDRLLPVSGANIYSYAGNDPIGFVDPLGLDKKGPLDKAKQQGCSLSLGQRITVGIQGYLNAAIGTNKVIGGVLATAGGLALTPETEGLSSTEIAVGLYGVVSGSGQAATGVFQLGRAFTGNGGPESTAEQRAAIASGPILGALYLYNGAPPEVAERAANVESFITGGVGLVNSSRVEGLIEGGVDIALTAAGIANTGGCSQQSTP